MTNEERIAKLEVEMENIKGDLFEVKKNNSEIMKRLSNLELKIALYTGIAFGAITLIEHLLRIK